MPDLTDIRMAVIEVNLHLDNVAINLEGSDDEGGYFVEIVYPGTPEDPDCSGRYFQMVADVFGDFGINDLLSWNQFDSGHDPHQYVHDNDHMLGGFWVPDKYAAVGF